MALGWKRRLRAAEELKGQLDAIVDAYQSGDLSDPALVKAQAWERVQQALLRPGDRRRLAWYRVVGEEPVVFEIASHLGTVVASRTIGPRVEGDPTVTYLLVRVGGAPAAVELLKAFRNANLNVRDWTYGG